MVGKDGEDDVGEGDEGEGEGSPSLGKHLSC